MSPPGATATKTGGEADSGLLSLSHLIFLNSKPTLGHSSRSCRTVCNPAARPAATLSQGHRSGSLTAVFLLGPFRALALRTSVVCVCSGGLGKKKDLHITSTFSCLHVHITHHLNTWHDEGTVSNSQDLDSPQLALLQRKLASAEQRLSTQEQWRMAAEARP